MIAGRKEKRQGFLSAYTLHPGDKDYVETGKGRMLRKSHN